MRSGEDIKNRALMLLGYVDEDGRPRSDLYLDVYTRSLALVNQIYNDLWHSLDQSGFEELPALTEAVRLPAHVADGVMPYGVAMLMAQSIGDADNQTLYAQLYDQKRALLSHHTQRLDVLPRAAS